MHSTQTDIGNMKSGDIALSGPISKFLYPISAVQHQGCSHIAPIVLSRDPKTGLFLNFQVGSVTSGDGIVNTVVQFLFSGQLPVF